MIKIILISSLVSASLASTAFMAAGRVHYSGLQLQTPFGSAFKMTPDPSNIWSYHEDVTPAKSVQIVIDFDNDGKMDTSHKDVRVMITDVQVIGSAPGDKHELVDSTGVRWEMVLNRENNRTSYEKSFTTPLVLPVGSKLEWRYSPLNSGVPFKINLIGRLVTL
jgi:hypothetical protein